MTTVDRAMAAYAAGFFDGEGHITIASKTAVGARGLCYTMRVGASQNSPRPLNFLQGNWGGSISAVKRKTAAGNTTYVWTCCSKQAAQFLRDVMPYLKVKRHRALLALRFQSTLFNPGTTGHTAKYRELMALMKGEMNHLNTHKPLRLEHA